MSTSQNGYIAPLGDLLDLLTVTNLRISHSVGDQEAAASLKEVLVSDISKRVLENRIVLEDLLIEVIRLAQANQEIWLLKEAMGALDSASAEYGRNLIAAHQVNGFRNKARNALSLLDKVAPEQLRSNTETDGLERS